MEFLQTHPQWTEGSQDFVLYHQTHTLWSVSIITVSCSTQSDSHDLTAIVDQWDVLQNVQMFYVLQTMTQSKKVNTALDQDINVYCCLCHISINYS